MADCLWLLTQKLLLTLSRVFWDKHFPDTLWVQEDLLYATAAGGPGLCGGGCCGGSFQQQERAVVGSDDQVASSGPLL